MKPHSPKRLQPVDDPARLFKLNWEIIYSECDLAPKHLECKPVLGLYLGSQFVRDIESGGVVHIPLNEDNLGTRYSGSLVGTLRRDQGNVLPMGAPIGIESYAVHRNDIGTPCYVDVGASMALVGDVVTEIQKRGRYEHQHELLIRTAMLQGDDHIRKGVITLRITGYQLGNAVKLPPPHQMPAIGTQALVLERIAATQQRDETVMSYVQATMQHELGFPDSLPNIQRVRVPMDISETGAAMTGSVYLPIAAFAMAETPRTNADYWVNAFERVMARQNLAGPRTPREAQLIGASAAYATSAARESLSAQAIAAYNQMDTVGKVSVMASMIAYAIQTMDYIGDSHITANRNDRVRGVPAFIAGESMTDGHKTGAGDCEDFAKGAVISQHALAAAIFDVNNPKHAPLRELQAISAEYIPTPALSIVHGAKIGDEEGFGAHMYLPIFPRDHFIAALARTSDGRAMLERMAPIPEPANVFVSAAVSKNPGATSGWKKSELVSATIEGTGLLPPRPGPDPILDLRRKVEQHMTAMHGFKKWIPHSLPNPFYLAICNVISDHFVNKEGVPVAGFVVGQVNPNHNPRDPAQRHEMTRGILYEDFLNGSPKMAIAPQPFIPKPVMAIIEQANSVRPPPRPHVLDWSKPMAGPDRDALLDRFVSKVRSFNRQAPVALVAAPLGAKGSYAPPNSVDVFVKPHQYTPAKVDAWIENAAQFQDLYDASYEVEHITNDTFTYRLRLWVK